MCYYYKGEMISLLKNIYNLLESIGYEVRWTNHDHSFVCEEFKSLLDMKLGGQTMITHLFVKSLRKKVNMVQVLGHIQSDMTIVMM